MNSPIGLRHMRYFLAVAEELHFGRAARLLGIAQPALSQQIAAIERAVGGPLLIRKPVVALTPAGRVFQERARSTIAHFDRAVSATERAARGETGSVAVGFAASAILTQVAALLRHFRARFPSVRLDLQELAPPEEAEAVVAGLVDVAFIREITAHPALRHQVVVREPFVLLVPSQHSLASHATVDVAALASEEFVHFPREIAPALFDQITAMCRDAGFSPIVAQYAREWLTELSLVNAGVGVAIVPASVGQLSPPGVHAIPISDTPVVGTIALCHRRHGLSPAATAFIRMARAMLVPATWVPPPGQSGAVLRSSTHRLATR